MLDIDSNSEFSGIFFHIILINSIIYFRFVAKDFDFLLSEDCVVRYDEVVLKVFPFFCSNNRTMVIYLFFLFG